MSGWCLGNLLPFSPRERLCCMIAATIADIDGLGILISPHFYERYHHLLGHNITLAVVSSAILAAFSKRKALGFVAYFALFHLHLYMDFWGSGPEWGICYFWPFQSGPGSWWQNPSGWAFFSWQNITAAALLLAWTIGIAIVCKRTPLELLMPSLDAKFLGKAQRTDPTVEPVA